MAALDNQLAYWSTTGTSKSFTHPLEFGWLDRLDRGARVLDYGCGYGRVAGLLAEHGFTAVEGVDVSPALIARARQRWPALSFSVLADPPRLPHTDRGVDAVVLFAVLTCVPTDEGQRRLISELRRVLRPGGLLYVSDLLLQDDVRNQDRYRAFAAKYGTYGVFETSDGAVCRHHTLDWLRALLGDLTLVTTREVPVETMNGHPVTAVQLLAAKPSK